MPHGDICCYTCEECGTCGDEVSLALDDRPMCPDCQEKCSWCGFTLHDGRKIIRGMHRDCLQECKDERNEEQRREMLLEPVK